MTATSPTRRAIRQLIGSPAVDKPIACSSQPTERALAAEQVHRVEQGESGGAALDGRVDHVHHLARLYVELLEDWAKVEVLKGPFVAGLDVLYHGVEDLAGPFGLLQARP